MMVPKKANDALRMPRNLFDREANVISGKENEFLTKVKAECAKISNLKDLDDFVDELANYGYPYSLEKDIDNAIKLQKSRIQKNGTKANDKDSFSDYWDFIYNNTHMSRQEAREYAVECWNKGISKYEAIKKKTKDSSRVIKQRNGYTLGINGSGTIYLAFPGETENNPHMYLGKENDKNLSDAKILFERFASTKDSASMVYDEIMAMMRPVTTKDQRATDFSSGEAKKVFEYIDRHVTKDMNDYPREIERAKTPDDCERLNNAIRSSLDNAVDEYIQIWNEVGLYAQKRKNEIVDRYGKLMSQAFKKYNELKSRE